MDKVILENGKVKYVNFIALRKYLEEQGWTIDINSPCTDEVPYEVYNNCTVVFENENINGTISLELFEHGEDYDEEDLETEEDEKEIPLSSEYLYVEAMSFHSESYGFDYHSHYHDFGDNDNEDLVMRLPIYILGEGEYEYVISEDLSFETIGKFMEIVTEGLYYQVKYLEGVSKGIIKTKEFEKVLKKYDFATQVQNLFLTHYYDAEVHLPTWSFMHDTCDVDISFYVEPFYLKLRSYDEFLGKIDDLSELSPEKFEEMLITYLKGCSRNYQFDYLFDGNPKTNKYSLGHAMDMHYSLEEDSRGRPTSWELSDEELDTISYIPEDELAYYKLKRDAANDEANS